MADNPKQTVIADGTEFDGSIRSQCAVSVSGKLKGDVQAPTLTVNASGAVQGQVLVSELTSQGEISGEIDAEVVVLSGRINDKTVINAKTLEVKLEESGGMQVMFGNCELNVGENTKRKAENKNDTTEFVHQTEAAEDNVAEPVL